MGYGFRDELKVGSFVAGGLAILLVSILLLGGDQMFLKSKYSLRAHFPDVVGLGKGSVVSLAGIPIGNIRELVFSETHSVEVVMDIDRTYQKRITEGTLASVKTQGALGDKYIYLAPGPLENKYLKDDAEIQVDNSGDIFDMIAKKGAEFSGAADVIKELRMLLEEINKNGRSGELMKNAVEATGNLNQLAREARGLIQEIRGSEKDGLGQGMRHLSSVMRKLDQGEGSLGALINDPGLHERLSNMVGAPSRNKFLKPLLRESIKSSESSK